MRLIILLFSIGFICCNAASEKSESTTQDNSATESSTSAITRGEGETINQNTIIPDAVSGGSADFTVTINGVTPGPTNLIGFYAESHFRADSSNISPSGVVKFKKKEGYPQGMYYVSLANNKFVQVILGEDQKFEMNTKIADINKSMVVKGSIENELLYGTMMFENKFNPEYKHITESLNRLTEGTPEYKEVVRQKKAKEKERADYLENLYINHGDLLFTQFKRAGQNPKIREGVADNIKVYHFRNEFWDNVDFSDRRLIRTPVIKNKLIRYMKELTPQNPDSVFASAKRLVDMTLTYPEYYKFFANWITIQYEPSKCTLMDPEAVFVKMARNYFTRERAFWSDSMEVYAIQNRAMEMGQSLVGSKAPNVISTDPDGNQKALLDLTSDYIIVYMFNPQCEHCLVQTPQLVEWHKKWKNKGADVFGIALDTNQEEWTAYLKKYGMNWTNVNDPTNRSIYAKYYVDVTPELYVINKDRIIIGKNLKVDQIETIINRDKGL